MFHTVINYICTVHLNILLLQEKHIELNNPQVQQQKYPCPQLSVTQLTQCPFIKSSVFNNKQKTPRAFSFNIPNFVVNALFWTVPSLHKWHKTGGQEHVVVNWDVRFVAQFLHIVVSTGRTSFTLFFLTPYLFSYLPNIISKRKQEIVSFMLECVPR